MSGEASRRAAKQGESRARRLLPTQPHPYEGAAAGRPFKLEPWQRRFVDELYKRDERGQSIFKRAILGIPRGNGKSPLAAGLGLYELSDPRGRARHHLRRRRP